MAWQYPDNYIPPQRGDLAHELFQLSNPMNTLSSSYWPKQYHPHTLPPIPSNEPCVPTAPPPPYFDPRTRGIVTPKDPRRRNIIRYLPVEIWLEIFAHSIPHLSEQERTPLSLATTPLRIGQISGGLRGIAHSVPQLWTTVCIVQSVDKRTLSVRAVNRILKLSNERPLTVSFGCSGSKPSFDSGVHRVFAALALSMDRWEHAVLAIPWVDLCQTSLPSKPRRLKTLTLHGYLGVNIAPGVINQLFKHARKLTSIAWEDRKTCEVPFTGKFKEFFPAGIPGDRLTKLDLQPSIFVNEALAILATTPHLEELKLGNLLWAHDHDYLVDPSQQPTHPGRHGVVLPCLRKLVAGINASYWGANLQRVEPMIGTLLAHLCTPALRELQLRNIHVWGQSDFIGFLTQSKCRLHVLMLHVVDITDEELAGMLSHITMMNSLSSLYIHGHPRRKSPLSQRVIEAMVPSHKPFLVPTLINIAVDNHALNQSGGAFSRMLQRRCAMKPRFLRTITVSQPQRRRGTHTEAVTDVNVLRQISRPCSLRFVDCDASLYQ
ncbi:hypothetical protein DFP72DRAFT_499308 [Ephemerocybe angulata]|uniref:F-box domain-containing protein n=1 Tax=Ephemerocybe angulata TaxID=980116 RepID=A0A8H6M0P7_9AGAR|nr:hypothetical protein DFP72DRAFT_499308 [Tulosesus angulatus]